MIMLFMYFLVLVFTSAKADRIYNMFIADFTSRLMESLDPEPFNCKVLSQTQDSSFVVIILYQSSGHFLGMGGILDSTTVITSEAVLEGAGEKIDNILVLAGYFSPWWGEHAQVRRVHSTHVNALEIALVKVTPRWDFNSRIRPLRIIRMPPAPDPEFTLYGVPVAKDFHDGHAVEKTIVYYARKEEPLPFDSCVTDYEHLETEVQESKHDCFFINTTFCRGCLGSPVAVIRQAVPNPTLLGVIIRASCDKQQVLMVKFSAFEDWMKFANVISES